MHQDVKCFWGPPRLPWKITRWKLHSRGGEGSEGAFQGQATGSSNKQRGLPPHQSNANNRSKYLSPKRVVIAHFLCWFLVIDLFPDCSLAHSGPFSKVWLDKLVILPSALAPPQKAFCNSGILAFQKLPSKQIFNIFTFLNSTEWYGLLSSGVQNCGKLWFFLVRSQYIWPSSWWSCTYSCTSKTGKSTARANAERGWERGKKRISEASSFFPHCPVGQEVNI